MGDAPLSHSFGSFGIAFKFFICTLHFRFAGLALEEQWEIGDENFVRSVANLSLAFHNILATNEVFRYVSFQVLSQNCEKQSLPLSYTICSRRTDFHKIYIGLLFRKICQENSSFIKI
jgi:hypothetical protein